MRLNAIAEKSLALGRRLLKPSQFLRFISEPERHDDLTSLANQYGSDKGIPRLDRHGYTRVYSALLHEYLTSEREMSERVAKLVGTDRLDHGGFIEQIIMPRSRLLLDMHLALHSQRCSSPA